MESPADALVIVEESKEVASDAAVIQVDSAESDEKLQFEDAVETSISLDRVPTASAFRRWVNSFRPRRTCEPFPHIEGWSECEHAPLSTDDRPLEQQWEELSGRSSHLGTIKTATMSIASHSLVRSRRTTQSTTNRSRSDIRGSIDGLRPVVSIDEEAQKRAIRRRQVLREIIATEADYIFGLKALAHLLLMFPARREIYHNVQQIRQTHEEFLRRIRNFTPNPDSSRMELERMMHSGAARRPSAVNLNIRAFQTWSLRTRAHQASIHRRLTELAAEANEALLIAREIGYLSESFPHYKELCENCELFRGGSSRLRRDWQGFDHGIEALTKSTASLETRSLYENKSLCMDDILVKPLQRLCRYPLLLEELLKWTHIQDDPSAYDEIRHIWESVRRRVKKIDEITDTAIAKLLVDTTRLLQEKLEFKAMPVVDLYEKLGAMVLCGVLHVTYQASGQSEGATGAFMMCVLFKHHFFLATMDDEGKFRPLACLYIPGKARIAEVINGQGYDYFCLFSWKLAFLLNGNEYEIVLSASSAAEERVWRTGILKSVAAADDAPSEVSSELRKSSFLNLDIAPIPEIPELTPQLSRRPSLQSLGTTGMQRARSNLRPIMIRKTHCPQKSSPSQPANGEVVRPRIPPPVPQPFLVMARRQDRIRLERAISDIYTRHVLPYPGMHLATGELFFGPSSIMRNLSLRSKRYKRSSSVNLPTALQNLSEPNDLDRVEDKSQATKKRKRRDASEFSQSPDHERSRTSYRDSTLFLGRSKTVRVKTGPRTSFTLHSQPSVKVDKGSDHSETPARKGIWSIFNSLSLRRPKKNARPSVGGVS
ncbi:hypothetical protein BJY04DRAFT_171916 [Aspergillus karnatakaensis]|uniref:putative Rho guanyl nucleotide exchange factor n=1 Tax=Aspergillus karnatakaensis TaxID=1810916 RepID=UPI003CCE10A9